jgi:hypothetical protein
VLYISVKLHGDLFIGIIMITELECHTLCLRMLIIATKTLRDMRMIMPHPVKAGTWAVVVGC